MFKWIIIPLVITLVGVFLAPIIMKGSKWVMHEFKKLVNATEEIDPDTINKDDPV